MNVCTTCRYKLCTQYYCAYATVMRYLHTTALLLHCCKPSVHTFLHVPMLFAIRSHCIFICVHLWFTHKKFKINQYCNIALSHHCWPVFAFHFTHKSLMTIQNRSDSTASTPDCYGSYHRPMHVVVAGKCLNGGFVLSLSYLLLFITH